MPRIYRSTDPAVAIPQCSLFSLVFNGHFESQLPALIDAPTGFAISRGALRAYALQLAWSLKNALCLPRGCTVAIISPNSIVWPVVLLGSMAAGLKVTTINSDCTPSEIFHQLKDSAPYFIFAHSSTIERIEKTFRLMNVADLEGKERIITLGDLPQDPGVPGYRSIRDLLGLEQLACEERFDQSDCHETALICYSSGTTSKPKGVELTHHNISSCIVMVKPRWKHVCPNGTIIGVIPLFHLYGLFALVLGPLYYGAPVVIVPHFDPESFCAYIQRYRATFVPVVPPILVVFANHPAPEKYDLTSLKMLTSAAAPLSGELSMAVRARLLKLGADVTINQAWGLTETSPANTSQSGTEGRLKPSSVGTLLSQVEARIVLQGTESDAPEGASGEIWIRGPHVMKGYLNNPSATRESITEDGWFKTGDIGIIDKDGSISILDRIKELIKYKGFQVPPAELEGILLTHPLIVDAAVIGIWSDDDATEYPRAYVVPRNGLKSLTFPSETDRLAREIEIWIRQKVARHKYLRGGVVLVDSVPKSASGKLLRRQLRDMARQEMKESNMRARL
ncbi:hypothetical protein M422DRAFT_231207 [Sphaerobolus stellatus SS14]|uniref:4-coumarate--CoA ligase n=1 Tax=Sphaerobolus stellatus (strain SS14) TaxID=990650 RepID=A0A0C9U671_SPHS4|nr:hypothetical protein M422DRAFT_231207 [Sphaerobolus stellatus SS14]